MKEHIEAGTELIYIDGQWYSKHDIDYLKSQSPKINSNTVSHSGACKARSSFGTPKPKKIEETKSPREEQLERLVLMQGEETRLVKQLERTRGVISHIKQWLEELEN